MFNKILIANRGEIACRVIQTARRLGIATVAVYSEADAHARHVELADEAYFIGPAPARESYLCGDKILAIAAASCAQAIHPGYGFLSENAEFAEAVKAAGLVFIGAPAASIRAMGSKSAAKQLMAQAGVPLVPGYHDKDQTPEVLEAAADEIGFPVLIKASAGGGGKGMKIVNHPTEFLPQLQSAQREALAAFGDAQVLVEKYLNCPRHIEIQVFADTFGNVVYLFERDCSVQRRHQKVLEEAPAPGMSAERRAAMGEAACQAARAIGYVGAGTVEFIADQNGTFYFMEMNTRLQVEHPVTEMITGEDLVEWQLRVAAGEPLPRLQAALQWHGHALEARIYAEDPKKDFLPAVGMIHHLHAPACNKTVRIDTGVRTGDEISIYYDPMIAKLIVWGEDRATALRRMTQALREYHLSGLTTNIDFLAKVVAHPAFVTGGVDTHFIERYREELLAPTQAPSQLALAAAAMAQLAQLNQNKREQARLQADCYSPWFSNQGWRLNDDNHHILNFHSDHGDYTVIVHFTHQGFILDFPHDHSQAQAQFIEQCDDYLRFILNGHQQRLLFSRQGEQLCLRIDNTTHTFTVFDPLAAQMEDNSSDGNLTAPMPGTVVAILTASGSTVRKGTPLLVMEAMKMEHTLVAPHDGTVLEIHYQVGDQVSDGSELLNFCAD